MKRSMTFNALATSGLALVLLSHVPAARPGAAAQAPPPPSAPGGFAGPQGAGRGGRGGGVRMDRALVAQFDKDGDKRLNASERREARTFMESQGNGRGPARGRGFAAATRPVEPGPAVDRARVQTFPATVPFYDMNTLRTLFLDFENAEWEKELMAFKDTDVEVPATLVIDGTTYKDVGVSFRGASSFMMIPEGLKHSLNVSVDAVHESQSVYGHRTLNLLNSNDDPSLLRAVLYMQAARDYLPAPRANLARVVINGESWGIYPNVEQFNKDFLPAWFKTDKGARWKVPGSPAGRGGLEYFGDDVAAYKQVYEIKSKDDPKDWAALVNLTKVLNETPADRLEAALAPILDIDGALKFLALEVVLVNNDGYWVRASDYSIYLDPAGKFHVMPHDANETFATAGGRGGRRGGFGPPPGVAPPGAGGPGAPGGSVAPPAPGPAGPNVLVVGPGGPGGFGGGRRGGGPGGGGPTLDLLVGLDDPGKPLRSKLLAVPALRAKYLAYARDIASKWLDWATLGPLVTKYQGMIATDVKADTRKLDTNEAFDASAQALKAFADQRRAFVLAAGR